MKYNQVSVLDTLDEIKEFICFCQRDKEFTGCNVVISKWPGKSYIIGKVASSLEPKYVLPIYMDYADPLQRPLISNAIHEAMYRMSLTASEMEDEMVCKAEPIEGTKH